MAGASDSTRAVSCDLLEWDSEHFGFPIAQVTGDTLTAESAEAIDDWCADHGIRCLYFLADPGDPETARVAAAHGYRLVDVRITMRRSLEGIGELPLGGPENLAIRAATEAEHEYVRALAARSHRGSRFYFDGGFPAERCDALYEAWMERGLRDPERTVRIPLVGRDPAGYHLLAPVDAGLETQGELTAVDPRYRRTGIYRALHVSWFRLSAERGALATRCPMSARNVASLRLHNQLGFLTEGIEVWHHKWFGDGHG
jgi:GNAT superfamily N-acetyltransferase